VSSSPGPSPIVVREYDDARPNTTHHSPELDEIIYSLDDLADSTYQWARWQFRGAKILLDRTDNERDEARGAQAHATTPVPR
jgi:hypothetical protein